MSTFPETEERETRRYSDAIATRDLDLTRPLGFMSPAERVRLFEGCVEPMRKQLQRLRLRPALLASATKVRFVLDTGEIDPTEPELVMTDAERELEALLLREIERTRAQILGGVVQGGMVTQWPVDDLCAS